MRLITDEHYYELVDAMRWNLMFANAYFNKSERFADEINECKENKNNEIKDAIDCANESIERSLE